MKTLIPFAALAALLPLVPATAAPPARSQVVAFDDLDLASPGGRAKLDLRLHRAARDVCGEASSFDLVGQNAVSRCQTDTVAAASQTLAQVLNRARPARVAVARQ